VLSVSGDTAVLLSYFRNNVLHLFTAVGGLLLPEQPPHEPRPCCGWPQRVPVPAGRTVPAVDEDEFAARIDRTIDVFVREGLLQPVEDGSDMLARNTGQTDEVFRLRAIGHSLQQAFERYYIATSVLVKNGPGTLGAAELESLCQQRAAPEPAVRAGRAGVLRQDPVPRLHPEAARTETGVAGRAQQAGVRRQARRLRQGRQVHPQPRAAPHHREGQPGGGGARSRFRPGSG
jgi:hypothetical protein